MADAVSLDAIVLRIVRYGDADVIAHLFTRELGRRNAIAKGARRQKSRLGTRLEPFIVVDVLLRAGHGDLAMVQGVELVAAHEQLRQSYAMQQAAAALDMLGRLSVEDAANEPAFYLTCKLLQTLDAQPSPEPARVAVLVLAFQLKLLHVTGLAPQLAACTRCGSADNLVAWSAADGGVVCANCREPGDRVLEPSVLGAAAWAMQRPLAEIAISDEVPTTADVGAVSRHIVEPMCTEHAGFRPRAVTSLT